MESRDPSAAIDSSRLELRRRSQVADHRSITDALSLPEPELPADPLGPSSERRAPVPKLNGQGGREARIEVGPADSFPD